MTSPITERTTAQLLGPEAWTEIRTLLVYNPTDPFAVRIVFGAPGTGSETVWLVSRELLRDGLSRPAGRGDVRFWPARNGSDSVFLHLRAPSGEALFEMSKKAVRNFLTRTEYAVPIGSETESVSFDDELRNLTGEAS